MSRNLIRTLSPNSIWDEEAVKDAFEELEIKPQQYLKFMREIYDQFADNKIQSLDEYEIQDSNISRKVYQITKSGKFALMTSKVIRREDSADRAATKLLIRLQDGEEIETVLMRYSNTQSAHTRTTICLSSQVGCAQACTFCATGMLGLSGSLTSGEIVEQFIWADARIEKIRNVVFMGQGEPLSNECYESVLTSVRVFTGPRFLLKNDRVTISTVGIVHNIYKVIDTFPNVTIALSLHAPTQTMREKIVPSARKYALSDLVNAIDYYHMHTKKKMLIEYVMLDDINSAPETAHLLGKLLQGRGVMVNLIPFNPVLTKAKHIAPSGDTVANFAQIVASYGILVTERKELGQDISGACGQLATVSKSRKKRRGYQITDDMAPLMTVQEDGLTRDDLITSLDDVDGSQNETTASSTPEETDGATTGATNTTNNDDADADPDDDEESSDNELVTDGLEGLVSAMGWMAPQQQESSSDTANTTTTENIDDLKTSTVQRSSILDNTGCGDGGDGEVDMEDLYTVKKPDGPTPIPAATPAAIAVELAQKLTPPNDNCVQNCACHRDYRHYKATEEIDANDNIKWSLAIIELGPILRKEQMVKKRGETDAQRRRRFIRVVEEESESLTGGSIVSTNSASVSVSTADMNAASTMKIHLRRKDLQPRVFMPSKVEQESIDLVKADWDAAPDRAAEKASDLANTAAAAASTADSAPTTTTSTSVTKPAEMVKPSEDDTTKKVALAVIILCIALLLARRML